MKRVHVTTSLEEAEAIRIALRDAGVESILENEHAAFSAVEMPTSAIPLGILVRDEEAARAAILIHELRQQEATPPGPIADEDRRFQQKLAASRRRSRWLWGIAFVVPFVLSFVAVCALRLWEVALAHFVIFVFLVVFGFVISERASAARR